MARIIYALSGQGRGHSSRVMAVSQELRQRGHEVIFCCGGTAMEVLRSRNETIIPVPSLRQVVEGNELKMFRTLWRNGRRIFGMNKIVDNLVEEFRNFGPDLIITDFEAFSPRAAARLDIPVMSFNHQEVVTRTDYQVPAQCKVQALSTSTAINLVAPGNAVHTLLTSFYFPPLKDPSNTTLVGPVIRPEVMQLEPTIGDHFLVYFNQPGALEYVLDEFEATGERYIVYNFPEDRWSSSFKNIEFKQPSIDGFLEDLASCRGIICTAGYTLISEALYVGKPIIVLPNRGIFEQTLNAHFLVESGLGDAVIHEKLNSKHLLDFVSSSCVEKNYRRRVDCGNTGAIKCIEAVLADFCDVEISDDERQMTHVSI